MPIVFHKVCYPWWLHGFFAWQKLFKDGLYIQYGRTVYGVEALYYDGAAIVSEQLYGTKPDLVRPVFFALAEDTHQRIIRIAAWVARENNFIIGYLIEVEYYFEVREILDVFE